MTAPLVLAAIAAASPRKLRVHAAQERAVAVEREPEARVAVKAVARARRARGHFRDARDLVARQAELAVAGRRQQVELAERPASADEHVRAREVRAAREVEADERNLRAGSIDAAAEQVRVDLQVARELREGVARIREQAEQPGRQHCRTAGQEALPDELPSRHGTAMVVVPLRRVGVPELAFDSDEHGRYLRFEGPGAGPITGPASRRCRRPPCRRAFAIVARASRVVVLARR